MCTHLIRRQKATKSNENHSNISSYNQLGYKVTASVTYHLARLVQVTYKINKLKDTKANRQAKEVKHKVLGQQRSSLKKYKIRQGKNKVKVKMVRLRNVPPKTAMPDTNKPEEVNSSSDSSSSSSSSDTDSSTDTAPEGEKEKVFDPREAAKPPVRQRNWESLTKGKTNYHNYSHSKHLVTSNNKNKIFTGKIPTMRKGILKKTVDRTSITRPLPIKAGAASTTQTKTMNNNKRDPRLRKVSKSSVYNMQNMQAVSIPWIQDTAIPDLVELDEGIELSLIHI